MGNLNRALRLRQLLETGKTLCCPAVYDPLSIRMAERNGFEAVFVSGSSMSCEVIGTSDVGVLSYGEYRNTLLNMLCVSSVPMIVDIDTGFGGPVTIYRTVREYEQMGIAAVMIEDQTFPKRCAYYDGLRVTSLEEMKTRITAVLKARTDPNFFLLARTDAAADSTQGMEEALRRAKLFREWGADGVYISTPQNENDLIQIGKLGFPTAVCITEGSPTGGYSVADFQRMGIRLAIFPQSLTRACIHTMQMVLSEIREKGRTDQLGDIFCTQEERANSTGLESYMEFEADVLRESTTKS